MARIREDRFAQRGQTVESGRAISTEMAASAEIRKVAESRRQGDEVADCSVNDASDNRSGEHVQQADQHHHEAGNGALYPSDLSSLGCASGMGADTEQAVRQCRPQRQARQQEFVAATSSILKSIQRPPERIKSYLQAKHVRYAA
jgi:hypothetical protein